MALLYFIGVTSLFVFLMSSVFYQNMGGKDDTFWGIFFPFFHLGHGAKIIGCFSLRGALAAWLVWLGWSGWGWSVIRRGKGKPGGGGVPMWSEIITWVVSLSNSLEFIIGRFMHSGWGRCPIAFMRLASCLSCMYVYVFCSFFSCWSNSSCYNFNWAWTYVRERLVADSHAGQGLLLFSVLFLWGR